MCPWYVRALSKQHVFHKCFWRAIFLKKEKKLVVWSCCMVFMDLMSSVHFIMVPPMFRLIPWKHGAHAAMGCRKQEDWKLTFSLWISQQQELLVNNTGCLAFIVAQFLGPVGIPTAAFALDSNHTTNHHANSLCNQGNNTNNNSQKCWWRNAVYFHLNLNENNVFCLFLTHLF